MEGNKRKLTGIEYRKIKEKLDSLKMVVDIIDSNEDDFNKAFKIYKIYCSADKFRKTYRTVDDNDIIDPIYKDYMDRMAETYSVLANYEENNIANNAKYIISIEKYLDNYEMAKKVIEAFIEDDKSYNINAFFNRMGITKEEFNFCVEAIKILDLGLFNLYEEKLKNEDVKKYYANIEAFRNIAHGIKTGYLLDGRVYDILDFWRLVPFIIPHNEEHKTKLEFDNYKKINPKIYYSCKFLTKIDYFTRATSLEDNKVIMKYVHDNKLYDYNYFWDGTIRKAHIGMTISYKTVNPKNKKDITVRQKTLTEEDLNNILEYIKVNELPNIMQVFKIVLKRYVFDELDLTQVKRQEKVLGLKRNL